MNDDPDALMSQIEEYLADGRILHLATVSNGLPWLSHLWYAMGPANLSVVFTSHRARRHSKEIIAHQAVAGGVVAIPLDGLGQKVRGLSFEGNAQEATGTLLAAAYESYANRWPKVRDMFTVRDIEAGATQMRMYLITLSRVVLFDEVNYPSNPRQELVINSPSNE